MQKTKKNLEKPVKQKTPKITRQLKSMHNTKKRTGIVYIKFFLRSKQKWPKLTNKNKFSTPSQKMQNPRTKKFRYIQYMRSFAN